jgi:hypothetical protein
MTYAIRLNEQGILIGLESYAGLDGQIEIQDKDLQLVLDYLEHNPNADTLRQLQDIQAWLKAHDYMINKHLLGEYKDNDKRWKDYLHQRKEKLEQYNALEVLYIDKEPFDLTLLTPVDDVVDDVVEQVVDAIELSEEQLLEDIIGENS